MGCLWSVAVIEMKGLVWGNAIQPFEIDLRLGHDIVTCSVINKTAMTHN